MKDILTFLLPFLSTMLFAQTKGIDSLLQLIKTGKQDTIKVNRFDDVAWKFIYNDVDSAMRYANLSLQLAEKLNHKKGIARAYHTLASVYYNIGDYDKALPYSEKSLAIKEKLKDTEGILNSLNTLGSLYHGKGNYTMALSLRLKALKIAEELDRKINSGATKDNLAICFNNIGTLYKDQANYSEALKYYEKALEMSEKSGQKKRIIGVLNNIGTIYNERPGEEDKALEYYQKALSHVDKKNDKVRLATCYTNIGGVYFKKGQIDKVLEYDFKSLKLFEEIQSKAQIALTLNNIAGDYVELKQYPKALEYSNKSLRIAKDAGIPDDIKQAYFTLSEIYSKMGNYKEAYKSYTLYTEVKDSLFNKENSEQMQEMSVKYETEKKEQEITLQKTQLEKKETEIEKQNTQKYALVAGLSLMFILAGVSYKGYRNKQKANNIITEQKKEVEQQKIIIEVKNKDITDSIKYAKRIQEAILPPQELIKQLLPNSFILYKPKDIVSGDFYWLENKEDRVLLAAVDCTGHGVPGALMSIVTHNGLSRAVNEHRLLKPSEILNYLNENVHLTLRQSDEEGSIKDGADMSLCSFDFKNYMLEFAGANNTLIIIRGSELIEVKSDKQPIGSFRQEKLKPFTNHEIRLQKHDTVYLFSDGYADQFGGEKGKKFKYSKLKELLLSVQNKSMAEQKDILNETLETWKGNLEQVDDVCVIGAKV